MHRWSLEETSHTPRPPICVDPTVDDDHIWPRSSCWSIRILFILKTVPFRQHQHQRAPFLVLGVALQPLGHSRILRSLRHASSAKTTLLRETTVVRVQHPQCTSDTVRSGYRLVNLHSSKRPSGASDELQSRCPLLCRSANSLGSLYLSQKIRCTSLSGCCVNSATSSSPS